MKNELQLLIEELQREHDYLEEEMKAYIEEWDFEGAEALRKPLIFTKEKLKILKNLDNANYDKIAGLKRRIERIKKLQDKDDISEFANEMMRARLPEYEAELERLEKIKPAFHFDGEELITCLEAMAKDQLKEFVLELEENEAFLEFKKDKTDLILMLKVADKEQIGPFGSSELKKAGFEIEGAKATKKVTDFSQAKVPSIMEAISWITYDVLGLYGNRQAKIIYQQ